MKRVLLCSLLFVPTLSRASDGEDSAIPASEQLQLAVQHLGWEGFLAEAKRQDWKCPTIPSRWHVEHVSKGEIKQAEMVGREFGRQLVDQLADLPPKLRAPQTQEQLYNYATKLLELSQWCGATQGYGNLYLSQRSLDLACVPLMRLVADSTFPSERYVTMLARLDPQWLDPEARRRLLNWEAGVELFHATTNTQTDLESVFGNGLVLEQDRHDERRKERRIRTKDPLLDWIKSRPDVANHLDFFVDDRPVEPWTLKAHWDRNWHWGIINSAYVRLAEEVAALAEYRRVMKRLPTEYTTPSGKVAIGEDAFREAWYWEYIDKIPGRREGKVHVDQKHYVLHASAWSGYRKVQQGEVLDADSRKEKLAREREEAQRNTQ